MMAHIFIPGIPVPQGSTTAYVTAGGHAVTTHANKTLLHPWRQTIYATVRAHNGPGIRYPTEPVTIRIWFIMPRPKNERAATRPHTKRPDLDKLIRAILDGLTGIVYRDDSQVHHILAHKRTAHTGETPGALVEWDTP